LAQELHNRQHPVERRLAHRGTQRSQAVERKQSFSGRSHKEVSAAPRRPSFPVVQQFLQEDRAARSTLGPRSAEVHRSITITMGSRSSRWTKDDLRAGAELGSVAAVGAIIGWLSGVGIIEGAAASIALFWLMLAGAYLLELRRQ
jgi:hypothetical protein